MAGMEVKDFWSFIKANEDLDKLYIFSQKYNKMSPQEKIIFLREAEKMSDAFEKVPSMIWEDEYSKYRDVMDNYREIKIDRWKEDTKNNKINMSIYIIVAILSSFLQKQLQRVMIKTN